MGNQHTTHVSNGSTETVRCVMTHPSNRNDDVLIAPDEVKAFKTAHGEVTVTVYRSGQDQYDEMRTVDSDYSWIVKGDKDKIRLVRAKYGTLRQEE